MPKPRLPLTPASSTDIAAMDKAALDDLYFALPPAAFPQPRPKRGAEFSLPPPPTRTRKIIQVKPKAEPDDDDDKAASSRKKSAATAAGRKIARRTAHSLIERRRRSKMNQEFATLKDMIPACRGHEMHKLAILQASIEYVNYLESCVRDLKAATSAPPTTPAWQPSSGLLLGMCSPDLDSAATTTMPSPAQSARGTTSTSTFDIIPMVLPSPALKPRSTRTYSTSTAASPLLAGEEAVQDAEMDREATAALLMLNNDRRHSNTTVASSPAIWAEGKRKVGMSVQDLLTH